VANYTFGKSLRLLNASAYKAVFDDATLKVSSQQVLFLARPNSLDQPRLGLVIAKKNVRLAVQRNRIKRAIRESFRLQQHQLNPIDVIVLARRGLDQLDSCALQQMFTELLQRLQKKALRKSETQTKLKPQTPPEG
jgi:ribonuclease P protein component